MWRVANSLSTLRDQVDAKWPNRNKSNDGTIGDAAHQAEHSEHNPDENGVVRAEDISNDPTNGPSSEALAQAIVASRDPRVLYVISNRKISNSTIQNWAWRQYNGSNPHDHHVHISVVADSALYDDTRPWNIDGAVTPIEVPTDTQSGKGSWYSQYSGKYEWVDTGDAPGSAALGVPDDAQGVAFYDHATLGHWFMVYAPNGTNSVEQQTDIGPSPSTGRKIDISAAAAERFGYSPKNFPTDGVFKWRPVAAPVSGTPQEQAVTFRDIRSTIKPDDHPPALDPDALAKLDAAVTELRALSQSYGSRLDALEQHKMPSNTQPQHIDWAQILKPIIDELLKALLPQLPKLLPLIVPALGPILSALVAQMLSGRVAFGQPAAPPVAPKADFPIGSLITTILGGLGTVLAGAGTAAGAFPPEAGLSAMAASGAVAAGGGTQFANSMTKPKT